LTKLGNNGTIAQQTWNCTAAAHEVALHCKSLQVKKAEKFRGPCGLQQLIQNLTTTTTTTKSDYSRKSSTEESFHQEMGSVILQPLQNISSTRK
jgi:hypothetical protein